jgi:hypothetical protein
MTDEEAHSILIAADCFANSAKVTNADLAHVARTVHRIRNDETSALAALAKRRLRTDAEACCIAELLMVFHPDPPADSLSLLYWRLARYLCEVNDAPPIPPVRRD